MQLLSPQPLHHVQLDAFRAMEPPGYWDGWEQRDAGTVRNMMAALCGAMCAAALQYSSHGQQVILDVALTNPQARSMVVDLLHGRPVYLVGVHCSAEELERRERQRGDRNIGLAASQIAWIHRPMIYDIEIDTTGKTAEAAAVELLAWLAHGDTPTALAAMQPLQNAGPSTSQPG